MTPPDSHPGMLGEMLLRRPCLQITMAFPSAAGSAVRPNAGSHITVIEDASQARDSGRLSAHVHPSTGRDPVASRLTVAFKPDSVPSQKVQSHFGSVPVQQAGRALDPHCEAGFLVEMRKEIQH